MTRCRPSGWQWNAGRGLTTVALEVAVNDFIPQMAGLQTGAQDGPSVADRRPFETVTVTASGNTVFVRRYGKGPAILLVHGFPHTSQMWRSLAPKLTESHTVICVDLRTYGRSGTPESAADHFPYSKRAMANELVEVMSRLGFLTLTLIGHDRRGRVSYRLVLDHPNVVDRLAVFDVIPMELSQGAATQVFLAGNPRGDAVTGDYWADCKIIEGAKFMANEQMSRRLWAVSEEIVAAHVGAA